MSSVRMCDKCGNIFSENDDGWSTFSGTAMRRREDGSRYSESVSQDACAACTGGNNGPVVPRIPAAAAAIGAAPFPAPGPPAPRADPTRIAELEHELGMDHDQVTHMGGPGATSG